jgi:hypothetical protein
VGDISMALEIVGEPDGTKEERNYNLIPHKLETKLGMNVN